MAQPPPPPRAPAARGRCTVTLLAAALLLAAGLANVSSDTLHTLRILRRRGGGGMGPASPHLHRARSRDAAAGNATDDADDDSPVAAAPSSDFYLSDLLDNLGLRFSFDAEDEASIALAEDGDEEGERGVATEEEEGEGEGDAAARTGAALNESAIVDAPSEEAADAAAGDAAAGDGEPGVMGAAAAAASTLSPSRRRPPARADAGRSRDGIRSGGGGRGGNRSRLPAASSAAAPRQPPLPSLLPPPLGVPAARTNLVRVAYEAQLRRLRVLPPAQRRYLRIVPLSGWGNKIRALSSGLKLALATDRIALVDTATMSPFYGPLFELPARPWFARHVQSSELAARSVKGGAGGWPLIEMRAPSKRNAPARCWVAQRSLSACVNMSAQLISYSSYLHMDALIHATPELADALASKLGTPLPPGPAYDSASVAWLLPSLSQRMDTHVRAVAASLRWDDYALVVGLHLRVFVDYWRRRVRVARIAPAFWECVRGHVAALQAARGVAPGAPNGTLLFVASDLPASREVAVRMLAGVADVRSAPSSGFVHTETTRNWGGLSLVLTDWWLLGEADLLIGTDLSTFAPTAAMRRRVPLVLSSLKAPRSGRRHKCAAKVGNDLGTDG